MSVAQSVANKIAPESGDMYMYPGCEFAFSGICCLGLCCPCIAVHQNWNAAENAAKGRAESFENKGMLCCLLVFGLVLCDFAVGGLSIFSCIGAFVQRMELAKQMKFEPYGPCPDMLCSFFCQPCTYHQDNVAIEAYKTRPQKGLVGAAMGAVGSLVDKVL